LKEARGTEISFLIAYTVVWPVLKVPVLATVFQSNNYFVSISERLAIKPKFILGLTLIINHICSLAALFEFESY
jgi:hypothetical protein